MKSAGTAQVARGASLLPHPRCLLEVGHTPLPAQPAVKWLYVPLVPFVPSVLYRDRLAASASRAARCGGPQQQLPMAGFWPRSSEGRRLQDECALSRPGRWQLWMYLTSTARNEEPHAQRGVTGAAVASR